MCHNVVELVKSNTKYCCRQPDIMGDKKLFDNISFSISISRQPDIMGDKFLIFCPHAYFYIGRQPDIMGDKYKLLV